MQRFSTSANPQHTRGNPWERANFISRIFFWWVFPYFLRGYKRDLNEDDLYDCALQDTSEYLGDSLYKEWDKQLKRQKNGKAKASLKHAVLKAFGTTYAGSVVICLFEECFARILQPVCLGWVVRYFSSPDAISRTECYLAGAGVCLMAFLSVCTHHPLFFNLLRTGMKVRIAACTLIYKKALKLSHAAMGKTTVGQMVNLLSNDVNRFDQSVIFLPYLVVGPIQTIITIAILWQYLGPSCLAGLVVLILFIPLQSLSGKIFSKLRSKTAALTDERIRLMNEIVSGMRVIKMYTWELPFAKLVDAARRREIKQIRFTSLLRGANIALFFSASKVIVFVCFITYVLSGYKLSAEIVFVSMSLYGNLRLSMTLFFPFAIAQWAEASISLQRIQRFLELEEQEQSSSVNKVDFRIDSDKCGVWMNTVSAKWTADNDESTLKDISVAVEAGELLAVVGPVGAGKSSLLMTILGELPNTKGDIKVRGKVAFSSQEPWVFSGTVQQNITFGSAMDSDKYHRVLEVCALDKDIEQFPYGDQSLVGERGVSLSGGQKARVNLARALYMDADIYLMDDPLSAVDIAVAKHLFDKCINGYLKSKARILVTHQIQFLKMCQKILVLKEGKLVDMGSFNDLVNKGVDIMSMLSADEKESPRKCRKESVHSTSLSREDLNGNNFRRTTSVSVSSIYQSVTSLTSHLEEETELPAIEENPEAPKQAEEVRAQGSVSGSVYWKYIKGGGGPILIFLAIATNLVTQLLYTGSDYWLALWTNAAERQNAWVPPQSNETEIVLSNDTAIIIETTPTAPSFFVDDDTNVIVYSGLVIALFFFSLLRTVIFFIVCMKSSVKLHDTMFRSITRAPMVFFDNNPIGRILNRFTKDLGLIDDLLPFTFFDMVTIFLALVAILGVVIAVSPWLIVPTVVLSAVFVVIRRFYIKTAREVKRLEGSTRSPVFSHISTSLYGITTIRAFGVQKQFEKDFCTFQDTHTSSWFILIATGRWFGVVLDMLTVAYITCVTIFVLELSADSAGGNVGLAISSALMLTGMFQWGVRQSAELESQMTAVERVLEYSKIPPEAELEASPDKKPPPDWPKEGSIVMKDFSLTYANTGDVPVLKNLNCHIKGGEKVGIVGRTGAGKSSIISALFRMAEPRGTLTIDGVNSQDIGLHDLRSKISIIPQDPVLFTGPIRRNLDPFKQRPDEELWNVLEEVQLKEAVTELPEGLDNQMSEGGGNFSVGQRQLVCLARALLRRNKILVLDEATANVDHRTDALIQNTIRAKFGHCTVLTIAHRLNTIMDCDRVIVLDAGEILEFDSPYRLLEDGSSRLSEMVKQTGPAMAKNLYEVAKAAARNKNALKEPVQNGGTPVKTNS